jgi:hypothetical protein
MCLLQKLARKFRLTPTDAAVGVALGLAVLNALAEFWRWLAAPPG